MKKALVLLSICIILICNIALPVMAAGETVTIASASATASSVTVSGTTAALAVAVQIRDNADNIVGMATLGVDSGSFSGMITGVSLTVGETYKIYVADYEGGPWALQEVVPVATPSDSSSSADNNSSVTVVNPVPTNIVDTPSQVTPNDNSVVSPKTSDNSGINGAVITCLVGAICIGAGLIIKKTAK